MPRRFPRHPCCLLPINKGKGSRDCDKSNVNETPQYHLRNTGRISKQRVETRAPEEEERKANKKQNLMHLGPFVPNDCDCCRTTKRPFLGRVQRLNYRVIFHLASLKIIQENNFKKRFKNHLTVVQILSLRQVYSITWHILHFDSDEWYLPSCIVVFSHCWFLCSHQISPNGTLYKWIFVAEKVFKYIWIIFSVELYLLFFQKFKSEFKKKYGFILQNYDVDLKQQQLVSS